jgi:hypothetical protein
VSELIQATINVSVVVPMTEQEARAQIAAINAGIQSIRLLLGELDKRKGWAALGYSSMRECMLAEFPGGQSHLYRQLEAARIERDISPTGEMNEEIQERLLRPLAPLGPDLRREVWAQVQAEGKKPTEARVQAVIDYGPLVRGPIGSYRERDGIKRCETCGELWGADLDYCPYCNISPEARIAHVQRERKGLNVHFSSDTPEHYTPQTVIDATLDCLGAIDLDPCSNNHGQPNVPAAQHFTIENDGLKQEWHGRVYMNPPYGREIEKWVKKLCAEHETGDVTEAIALVPSRTDTRWWMLLRDYPVCFVAGRLTFVGNQDPAPFPSAIFYLGENIGRFYRTFAGFGDCWQRMMPGISFGE